MTTKVKICGIRSLETAQIAIESGADYIGFNFVPTSKRYIAPKLCQTFINDIKGRIKIVGVFRNAPVNQVNNLADMLDLDYVQLHGEEDAQYIKKIKRSVIKKVTVLQSSQLLNVSFFLLDRIIQGKGAMVDYEHAKDIAKEYNIFFAGGLTPENVGDVITYVKPFAVDVAGGIEKNGKEDLQKIKRFIENAKGVIV